jgi:hypothetical protein
LIRLPGAMGAPATLLAACRTPLSVTTGADPDSMCPTHSFDPSAENWDRTRSR